MTTVRLSQVCGIPVRMIYRPMTNQTELFRRDNHEFLPYQKRIIAGWLEYRGYRVVGQQWSYIPVQGYIDPVTL